MLIGENDLDRRLREGYVNDPFAQHYFDELRQKRKVKNISLKDRLFKWKQSQVYVPSNNLHTKVLEEIHDILMVGH
jgi:ribosomal protein S21